MPELAPGQVLRSRAPTVLVENQLQIGAWRFRLTVIDDDGVESAPAELVVNIVRAGPVIDPRIGQPPIVDPRPLRPPR